MIDFYIEKNHEKRQIEIQIRKTNELGHILGILTLNREGVFEFNRAREGDMIGGEPFIKIPVKDDLEFGEDCIMTVHNTNGANRKSVSLNEDLPVRPFPPDGTRLDGTSTTVSPAGEYMPASNFLYQTPCSEVTATRSTAEEALLRAERRMREQGTRDMGSQDRNPPF